MIKNLQFNSKVLLRELKSVNSELLYGKFDLSHILNFGHDSYFLEKISKGLIEFNDY